MSTVLAYKDGDKVWLAADSQATKGDQKILITDPNNFKIWRPKMHQNLIMGGIGTLRDLNIVSTVDVWFDEKISTGSMVEDYELNFSEMVRTIVPSLQSEITSLGGHNKSSFFMAYKDKCFSIDPDGCVIELYSDNDYAAIGSGEVVTEAAFSVLHDLELISTKEKIVRAVGQSCEQDLCVNYPILIMNTKDLELEIFDGEFLHTADGQAIPFHEISDYEFQKEIVGMPEFTEEDFEDEVDEKDLRCEITD